MTWRFAEKAASVQAIDVNGEKIEAATQTTPAQLMTGSLGLVGALSPSSGVCFSS